MLNSILIAFSIIFGGQMPNSSISGTYSKLKVTYVNSRSNNKFIKLTFSNPTYFSNNMNQTEYCKVLVFYIGEYSPKKWSNYLLKKLNYSQFDHNIDQQVRMNINSINDKPFLDVYVEGGIKEIGMCIYYADAIESNIYNERTRMFRMGYIPVQTESPFWWNYTK